MKQGHSFGSHFSLNSATPGKVCRKRISDNEVSNFLRSAYLALKQLKTGTSTSADMAQFTLISEFRYNGCSVTTSNNDGSTFLDSLFCCLE
jgi:hypothetical protein